MIDITFTDSKGRKINPNKIAKTLEDEIKQAMISGIKEVVEKEIQSVGISNTEMKYIAITISQKSGDKWVANVTLKDGATEELETKFKKLDESLSKL